MKVFKSKRVISRKINKLIHRYGYLKCFSFLFGSYTYAYGFAKALLQYKSQGASRKFVIDYIYNECITDESHANYWAIKINNLLKED